MLQLRTGLFALLTVTSGLLASGAAHAASLQSVSNWGSTGMPSDITMKIYVPDKVATNPPVLALIHYCGGTADAVFGQAQSGGIVSAADQYGFIMVVPSSGRCWDVVSDKTRTRDDHGDSHAIKQMVEYAIQTYKGNADRVYSTGDSSGGMMTELLLALYPDIFKAGAAFAGMPAGCRAASNTGSSGGYDGSCAGGSVTHTADEWGTIVRNMDPGYTGHRPRVQLFHGDADNTISYTNFTEAIKEWTNVLGLATDPTTTTTGLTLGTHQATRKQWKNSCGYVVLDALTSIGGDHGPSDALFKSTYVIPLLGLDKTGAVDPEISECGSDAGTDGGGSSGAGGSTSAGSGGSTGAGGSSHATGSTSSGAGGSTGSGGSSHASGSTSSGAGGSAGSGGSSHASTSAGGAQGSGGTHDTGSASATGGSSSSSGSSTATHSGSGGSASSGSGNSTSSGAGASSASDNTSSDGSSSSSGCSIGAGPGSHARFAGLLGLALAALSLRRRRGV